MPRGVRVSFAMSADRAPPETSRHPRRQIRKFFDRATDFSSHLFVALGDAAPHWGNSSELFSPIRRRARAPITPAASRIEQAKHGVAVLRARLRPNARCIRGVDLRNGDAERETFPPPVRQNRWRRERPVADEPGGGTGPLENDLAVVKRFQLVAMTDADHGRVEIG